MITGIGHIAFRVTNLRQALDFYCDTLGFSEAFRLEQEGHPRPGLCTSRLLPALLSSCSLIHKLPQEPFLRGIRKRAINMYAYWLMTCRPPLVNWHLGVLRLLKPLP